MAAQYGPPSWASRESCSRSYSQVSEEEEKQNTAPYCNSDKSKRTPTYLPTGLRIVLYTHEHFICVQSVRKYKDRFSTDMGTKTILTLPDRVIPLGTYVPEVGTRIFFFFVLVRGDRQPSSFNETNVTPVPPASTRAKPCTSLPHPLPPSFPPH